MEWQQILEEIDRTAADRKEKSERWNKPRRLSKPLRVGDKVVVQNFKTKLWDRYGMIQEYQPQFRRYVVRCESGMILKRNRIHLRLRFSDTATHKPAQAVPEIPERVPIAIEHPMVETIEPPTEIPTMPEPEHQQEMVMDPEPRVIGSPIRPSPVSEPSNTPAPLRRSTREKRKPVKFQDYVPK